MKRILKILSFKRKQFPSFLLFCLLAEHFQVFIKLENTKLFIEIMQNFFQRPLTLPLSPFFKREREGALGVGQGVRKTPTYLQSKLTRIFNTFFVKVSSFFTFIFINYEQINIILNYLIFFLNKTILIYLKIILSDLI